MPIRIIFDKDALIAAGAKQQPTANNHYQEIRLEDGFKISLPDNGDPFVDVGDRIEQFEMPTRLSEVVRAISGFSYYDNICPGFIPRRRVGDYRLGTASAVVTDSNKSHYHLQLRSKNFVDLRRLHRLVCEGKVWPVGDYEAEMVPPPLRNVRALLHELWEVIRRDVSLRFHRA